MLVVPGYVNKQNANFLIDSGASSSFINEDFVKKHQFKTHKVDPKRVRLANGQLLTTSLEVQDAVVKVQSRTVKLTLIVLELNSDVILGFDWLSITNPTIDFSTKTIQFCSTENCRAESVHR